MTAEKMKLLLLVNQLAVAAACCDTQHTWRRACAAQPSKYRRKDSGTVSRVGSAVIRQYETHRQQHVREQLQEHTSNL